MDTNKITSSARKRRGHRDTGWPRRNGDVVLVASSKACAGKALDLAEAAPVEVLTCAHGTNPTKRRDSDVVSTPVVVCRKPGMRRDDLLRRRGLVGKVGDEVVVKRAPNPILKSFDPLTRCVGCLRRSVSP